MTSQDSDAQVDGLGNDPGQIGPDSGGQSGDMQGLSRPADDADESVEELATPGRPTRQKVMEGMEDAADHPERPVHTREDQSRPVEVAPDRRSDSWPGRSSGVPGEVWTVGASHRFDPRVRKKYSLLAVFGRVEDPSEV